MTRYILALSELGLKNNNLISLLREHSSEIVEMFEGNTVFDRHLDLMTYYEQFSNKGLTDEALAKADAILYRNDEEGIKTTYYTAATYPKELAKIANPPAILYYKGAEFSDISEKSIACVGTRKPTPLSYNAINYLVPQWVNEGCSIISGLACGVDKISHQACMTAGGKTIAVLAHGLDMIYPKENSAVAQRILDTGGILMSEYPIGTKPDKFRFVNRNRLIVGLSKVVIIYECDIKGGTMHNVEHAAKQSKQIFCPAINGEITEMQTGTKKLLDDNTAIEIAEGRDIGKVLESMGSKLSKPRLRNGEIKRYYLESLFYIMNENAVLYATLQNCNLNIDYSLSVNDIFNFVTKKIADGKISIDEFINTMVKNNIQSIAKTLNFTD